MKTPLLLITALAACAGSEHGPAAATGGGSAEPEPMMGSATGSGDANGSAAAPEGSAAGSAAMAGSAADPATKAWKDMDKKERAAFMRRVVLPKSRELFATIAPTMHVTCKTCHGKGAADHTFKMPSSDLEALPATEKSFMAWIKKNPDEAKWSKFMGEQLVPAMAELLGTQAFDPETKTGDFSCTACHTLKK